MCVVVPSQLLTDFTSWLSPSALCSASCELSAEPVSSLCFYGMANSCYMCVQPYGPPFPLWGVAMTTLYTRCSDQRVLLELASLIHRELLSWKAVSQCCQIVLVYLCSEQGCWSLKFSNVFLSEDSFPRTPLHHQLGWIQFLCNSLPLLVTVVP